MKLYALYYYDRPLLPAFLSHYCQFKVIDEIIIQNQNWSREDSLFLLDTVATYVDKYRKKIVVLPSRFRRGKGDDKRNQFRTYGIPTIQNRITQFLRGVTWIWGAITFLTVRYAPGMEGFKKWPMSCSCNLTKVWIGFFCLWAFFMWPTL